MKQIGMSLGQSNMFANNKRSQMLGHATSAMRQFSLPSGKMSPAPAGGKMPSTPAGAPAFTKNTTTPHPSGEIPIKIKIEALEIAIGALSERLGDLAEQSAMTTDTDVAYGSADIVQLKSQVSTIDLSVAQLKSDIKDCHTLCAASSHPAQAPTLVDQSGLMTIMAMATQMVHATVTDATTWVYANTTGDPEQDIVGLPEVLAARSRVRLVFPQHKHEDGSLYMGVVWINPTSMQVNTGWICLTDPTLTEPRVCDFTV